MERKRVLSFGVGLLVTGVMQGVSFGQMRPAPPTPAAQYFGRQHSSNATPENQPSGPGARHHVPAPQMVQASESKPFQHIQQPPTLSPYLSLDLVPETSTSVPNYHAFVLPQIQQRAANESQTRELQRLRQKMRGANERGIVSRNANGGVPTTGSSEQFMNLGSYFPGLR
jgi:hypothetical protein